MIVNSDLHSCTQMQMGSKGCQLVLKIVMTQVMYLKQQFLISVMQVHSLPVIAIQLQSATRRDPTLSKVFGFTQQGWPVAVGDDLKPYRAELDSEGGCILWGIRVKILSIM